MGSGKMTVVSLMRVPRDTVATCFYTAALPMGSEKRRKPFQQNGLERRSRRARKGTALALHRVGLPGGKALLGSRRRLSQWNWYP
jgi:hypothetical protein